MGKIGGGDRQVKNWLKHVLSCIDKGITFEISDVRALGSASSSQPPIYEVCLDNAEAAEDLRKSFARFTRKKNPVRCPPELEGVKIFNSVTLATRVRISVLRVRVLVVFCSTCRFMFLCFSVCMFFEVLSFNLCLFGRLCFVYF